jgi:hypothetical protein
MSPEQIVAARRSGLLDDLSRGIDHGTVGDYSPPEQLTRADLTSLSPAEIVQARRDGRLAALMAGSEPTYE